MKIRLNNTFKRIRFASACLALSLAAATAPAAVIQINSISGITLGAANGGLADGGAVNITLVPGGGSTTLRNNAYNQTGLMETQYQPAMNDFGMDFPATLALEFALSSNSYASPYHFGAGATIDSSALWTYSAIENSEFKTTTYPLSPDFGANSYIGFRSGAEGSYNYGYLEVTWSGATQTFTIDGGAYESTPNVAITTPQVVPEPTTLGLLTLGSGAMLLLRRRRASL